MRWWCLMLLGLVRASLNTVTRWDHPIAQALVRSQRNTKNDAEEVTLAPICPEEDCADTNGTLSVPFNTRSYFQARYAGECDATPFGSGNYTCVDYDSGKLELAGQTLTFEVDLSADGCGCNAALYLVSMAQSVDESACHDRYCDANDVCGVRCPELDLMEANTVAWVSTAHVADDGAGQGFGQAHYVFPEAQRLRSETHDCPYGPSVDCAINTQLPFEASISFTAANEPFGYNVLLRQGVKAARLGPVRYVAAPQRGDTATAEAANALLRQSLDAGMTLVVSHWAGPRRDSMGWLDSPCKPGEINGWGCTDTFVEHERWEWLCPVEDASPPVCGDTFTLKAMSITSNTPKNAESAHERADDGAHYWVAHVTVGLVLGGLLGALVGYLLAKRRTHDHQRLNKEDNEPIAPIASHLLPTHGASSNAEITI